MIQLILHLLGDYVTQSDWMAQNKTKCSKAAAAHAITYSLPFLLLKPSWAAFAVILVTHFFIDRFRLARYVVWAKNVILQPKPRSLSAGEDLILQQFGDTPYYCEEEIKAREARSVWEAKWAWKNCSGTGYPADAPPWLAVWLLIACDNTLHLLINWAALTWL